MKTIIYILIIGIFSTGCLAQKQQKISKKTNTMLYIPTIDEKFEKFDFVRYNNRKDVTSYTLREYLNNGNYIEMGFDKDGGHYIETPKDSYFKISKGYYPNGNIKLKGLTFNVPWGGTLLKGTWYEFNEQGRLIKETNYDQYYKFSFEQVLAFCEKEGIQVDKGPIRQSTGYHTIISRGRSTVFDDVSWWEIRWLKKPDVIETIKLDGNTGAVKSREENKYINN